MEREIMNVSVIIPALNEEKSIGEVLCSIPPDFARDIIVVDNGSTDRTGETAAAHGARVVLEPVRGYGRACLRGIAEIRNADVVVFLDGDFSDYPEEMPLLVEPIEQDRADLVIGSRALGRHEKDALPSHAALGNRLAGWLIWRFFGHRYSDLGPFRAIRFTSLQKLGMADRNFGWTVEMQVKAVRQGLRIQEVPVSYRKRIGTSKVSGTVMGSIKAGAKILWTIFKYALACTLLSVSLFAQTFTDSVEVQVVDLQISVTDERGNFLIELQPEDFIVTEDGVPQEILDLVPERQPFSIGVLLDTSSSMQSIFQIIMRGTRDFLSSLKPEDEYFLMTFDEKILMRRDFSNVGETASSELEDFRFGDRTRLFEGLLAALDRLRESRNPRRALFLMSDGVCTLGGGNLGDVIQAAQRSRTLVYTLIIDKSESDWFTMRTLAESTGGTYFVLYDEFPRLQAAYEKIAEDLAHRFTLYYHSRSEYSERKRPAIQLKMRNPRWKVAYQKAYYR